MSKKKVLVVDDEQALTRLVKLILEATGEYEVHTENNGVLGLQAARDFRPDLILLDIIMPDMEGVELARLLREEESLKLTPIVFLTATVTKEAFLEQGPVIQDIPLLAKPISSQDLVDFVRRTLGS